MMVINSFFFHKLSILLFQLCTAGLNVHVLYCHTKPFNNYVAINIKKRPRSCWMAPNRDSSPQALYTKTIHETLPLFCRQKCVQHSLQMQCTQWGLTLCRKVAVFVHRWFDEKIICIFIISKFHSSSGATEFQNDLKNAFNSICNECIILIIPG